MVLGGRMPVVPPGRLAVVDVRDIASVHAAVMQRGRGPRRFLAVSEDVPFAELIDVFRRVTGRRLPGLPVPRALSRGLGRVRRVPGDLEGPWICAQEARTDSGATEASLGVRLRPAEESIADTIRWLHASGHLDDRRAGAVASAGRIAAA